MAAVGSYVWSGDRAGNNIEVIDAAGNTSVGTINLAGAVSDDPAPDLMDAAPDGSHVFVALRGPSPLTGNDKAVNNAVGSTPGVGVVTVSGGGKGGELVGVARVSNMKEGKETADPHGIAVRK
jgi:DNA-binding beta-propeller fold protein YncE